MKVYGTEYVLVELWDWVRVVGGVGTVGRGRRPRTCGWLVGWLTLRTVQGAPPYGTTTVPVPSII